MKKPIFKKITVVGVGLLGGSIGLGAKAADERITVVGVGRRKSSLDQALAAARKVMLRRGRHLDEGLELVYGRLFEEGSQARARLS